MIQAHVQTHKRTYTSLTKSPDRVRARARACSLRTPAILSPMRQRSHTSTQRAEQNHWKLDRVRDNQLASNTAAPVLKVQACSSRPFLSAPCLHSTGHSHLQHLKLLAWYVLSWTMLAFEAVTSSWLLRSRMVEPSCCSALAAACLHCSCESATKLRTH